MKRVITSILLFGFFSSAFALKVEELTCEMKQNPLAVETERPRLGWKLTSELPGDRQTAYRVTVFSESGECWNSGKVKSDQSQLVLYKGKSLQKGKAYSWKVSVWDKNGKEWKSEAASFETAPDLSTGKARWIGAVTSEKSGLPTGRRDLHSPSFKKPENKALYENINPLALRSILLRKTFSSGKKVKRAVVHVSGLGHYALFLNGKEVSKDIFTPVWSDYDKTVYYNTYRVDSLLNSGENAVGVILGNGFYNAVGNRYRKLWISFGPPTLFFTLQMEYEDGSREEIVSDASWKYVPGPIVFNDIYGGEDYDARLEQPGWDRPGFEDVSWKPVVLQQAPRGILRAQQVTSVREMEEFGAIKMSKTDSSYVLDMGQNLSGYPVIKVMGKKGQTVKLTVGELLHSELRTVSQKQSGGPHTYSYTLKGEGVEEWHPRFSYYGFQYIQIDGADVLSGTGEKPLIVDVKSRFIYNAVPERGRFECSNEIFSKAHVLIKNAVKSNMQSVFTDCPHREKLGWLEETHLNGPGLLYNWDLTQFYSKVMRDAADAQQPGGLVPSIVPEYVVFDGKLDMFRDSPEWGIACVMVPWLYYRYYGDDTLLKDYFEVMKKYVDHLTGRADGHVLSHGLGDWYDYGEHRAGFSMNSPVEVSATAHYYYAARLVAKAAEHFRKTSDRKQYERLAEEIKKAFNDRFFDKNTKQYGSGSQFCNAVALFMDLVKPGDKQPVMENLKADIKKHGNRLTTGDVGNRYLFMALALNGENELMYLMHDHEDAPGYGFQLKFGVTTLTEQWDPRKGASWNHFMMGQIDEWFYRTLAGIEPLMPGFKEFKIQPVPVGDMTWVSASHTTLYGEIKVDWKRENGLFLLDLTVPVNTTATVVLPDRSGRKVTGGAHRFECKY